MVHVGIDLPLTDEDTDSKNESALCGHSNSSKCVAPNFYARSAHFIALLFYDLSVVGEVSMCETWMLAQSIPSDAYIHIYFGG